MKKQPSWYDGLYDQPDDALAHALELLEDLRGALPYEKQGAVDEARELLMQAVELYQELRTQQKGAAPR